MMFGKGFASFVAIATMLSVVVGLVVIAQVETPVHLGDPVSPEDSIFVDLDSSRSHNCGVTAANNIRCWGQLAYAPIRADGFVDVANGRFHSCGIKIDGTVQCWGSSTQTTTVPTNQDGTPFQFSMIDSFNNHTCGIKSDNDQMVCWGSDGDGQVSGVAPNNGSVGFDYSESTFKMVDVGREHTCAILKGGDGDGQLRCWGSNGSDIATVPTQHQTTEFISVALGDDFTCALTAQGQAVCWGLDQYQEVTQVPVNIQFSALAAGHRHVCGIKTDGTPHCWGAHRETNPEAINPGLVPVPDEFADVTFAKLSAGLFHNCGILDDRNGDLSGTLACWGSEFPDDPTQPARFDGIYTITPDAPFPFANPAVQIATGSTFNCTLTTHQDISCWGDNTRAPQSIKGPFIDIEGGFFHICAVRASGHIRCWGDDVYLQSSGFSSLIGDSLLATGRFVENLTTDYTFKSVSAGDLATCGILDGETQGQADGAVLCWGLASNGQAQPPENSFSSISVGDYHGCGLLDGQNGQTAGTAVCWGAENNLNDQNEVVPTVYGLDPMADFGQADVPERLADVKLSSISAARYHSCAIRADNHMIECWGRPEIAEIPDEIQSERFVQVHVSGFFSCGITTQNRVKCWGPTSLTRPGSSTPESAFNLNQFHVPAQIIDSEFTEVSTSRRHACAISPQGTLACWGADAVPSTNEIDVYSGRSIINTGQSWVPPAFRRFPMEMPSLALGHRPTHNIRILRIEPSIRSISLKPGQPVRLNVEVFGRQDMRDDSLGDRPDISFEWLSEDPASPTARDISEFREYVEDHDDRERNSLPDDRRVLHISPDEPGRYQVKAMLDPGAECLPKRAEESDEDALTRCSAIFHVTVIRPAAQEPTSVPPRNPDDAVPEVIVSDDGTNYDVFTPEEGGEFTTDNCSFKAPKGAVNDMEVIGITITELVSPEEQLKVSDPRYITDGLQCRMSAVAVDGAHLNDYRLIASAKICMTMPDSLRPKLTDSIVGVINPDATLTTLSSSIYLANSAGELKVCGNINSLSATTTVALRAEVARELPSTPAPTPEIADIDTGAPRLTTTQLALMAIMGSALAAIPAAMLATRKSDVRNRLSI